jgi:hypothetical protein
MLLCVVLCAMVAFAAEPTTSTEYDLREGRAHGAYVAGGTAVARTVTSAVAGTPVVPALLAALAALLAIVGGSRTSNVLDRGLGQDRSALRWAVLARRGPPARV